jgi:hypothetical protein
VVAQRACKRCGHAMPSVAEIAPFGGGPGLVAFMCTDCNTTDSILVHQAHRSHEATRRPVGEHAAAMSNLSKAPIPSAPMRELRDLMPA